jgi:hypothetical protein
MEDVGLKTMFLDNLAYLKNQLVFWYSEIILYLMPCIVFYMNIIYKFYILIFAIFNSW